MDSRNFAYSGITFTFTMQLQAFEMLVLFVVFCVVGIYSIYLQWESI